jgi:hypothetical protein
MWQETYRVPEVTAAGARAFSEQVYRQISLAATLFVIAPEVDLSLLKWADM